jgi:choline-sulfatase
MVIPVPPDFADTEPYTPTESPPSPKPFEKCPDYQRYGGNMQEYLRLYYAMVSHVDACVGEILKALDDLGIRKETNIIFTSDHGDMQGSRGLRNKCLPYERSCGIPFIISAPGTKEGQVFKTPISSVDVYPTLLALHGLQRESHLEGYDFSPLLWGRPVEAPPVFCESYHPFQLSADSLEKYTWKMAYDGKYKLTISWQDKKPRLLYDMEADPWEQHNLAGKGTKAEKQLTDLIVSRFRE